MANNHKSQKPSSGESKEKQMIVNTFDLSKKVSQPPRVLTCVSTEEKETSIIGKSIETLQESAYSRTLRGWFDGVTLILMLLNLKPLPKGVL